MTHVQWVISVGLPSLLVILSWVHNNTRLNRLETAVDAVSCRMDDLQSGLHNDMLSFQASIMGEISGLRERVAVMEVRR